MSRIITATSGEAVEPGAYMGTLRSIDEGTGKFGDYYDWNFVVAGPAGSVDVDRRTSQKFGPQTIARQFVEALLGRKVEKGEQIDLDALIGKNARLKIDTNENGFSTIADIAPAQRQVSMDNGVSPMARQQQEQAVLAAAGPGAAFVDDDVPF